MAEDDVLGKELLPEEAAQTKRRPALITPYIKYEEEPHTLRREWLAIIDSDIQIEQPQEENEGRVGRWPQLETQLNSFFKNFSLFWLNFPKSLVKIMEDSLSTARAIIGKDLKGSGVRERVRPPRFIGFNRELEIYSSKKTLAFQILYKHRREHVYARDDWELLVLEQQCNCDASSARSSNWDESTLILKDKFRVLDWKGSE